MTETTIISLQNCSVQLGGKKILENVTFDIQKGEFIAVLGPNGAGKSTLLKLLLGLLHPTSGKVEVLEKNPRRGNNKIGYAPQHRVLETDLALRARDVVGFGLDGNKWGFGLPNKNREKQIDLALKEVDAYQFAEVPVGRLSGGEQQRLLVAQALITNPEILLLDEPLSNLDINHGKEIIALLVKLARERGVTTLLVSHDVNPLLPYIDRVVFMANGHSAIGTPDKVITSETLSILYKTQVEVIQAKGRIFVVGAEI